MRYGKKLRRTIALVLSMLLVCSLIQANAFAAENDAIPQEDTILLQEESALAQADGAEDPDSLYADGWSEDDGLSSLDQNDSMPSEAEPEAAPSDGADGENLPVEIGAEADAGEDNAAAVEAGVEEGVEEGVECRFIISSYRTDGKLFLSV